MKKFWSVWVLAGASLVWAGTIDADVDKLLKEYFKIQTVLAKDSKDGVDAAAAQIVNLAAATKTSDAKLSKIVLDIKNAAEGIQGKDLEKTRIQFFELSKPFLVYLNQFHSNKDQYFRYHCPHANKAWVQAHDKIRNPYYGSSMLECGNLIK
jgi:hypothetical protein